MTVQKSQHLLSELLRGYRLESSRKHCKSDSRREHYLSGPTVIFVMIQGHDHDDSVDVVSSDIFLSRSAFNAVHSEPTPIAIDRLDL